LIISLYPKVSAPSRMKSVFFSLFDRGPSVVFLLPTFPPFFENGTSILARGHSKLFSLLPRAISGSPLHEELFFHSSSLRMTERCSSSPGMDFLEFFLPSIGSPYPEDCRRAHSHIFGLTRAPDPHFFSPSSAKSPHHLGKRQKPSPFPARTSSPCRSPVPKSHTHLPPSSPEHLRSPQKPSPPFWIFIPLPSLLPNCGASASGWSGFFFVKFVCTSSGWLRSHGGFFTPKVRRAPKLPVRNPGLRCRTTLTIGDSLSASHLCCVSRDDFSLY